MATEAQSVAGFGEDAWKWEDLGYSTLFVPDHLEGFPLAPLSAMAIIAHATTRLFASAPSCWQTTFGIPPCWRARRRPWTFSPEDAWNSVWVRDG